MRERVAGTPGDTRIGAIPDASHGTALLGVAIIGLFLSAEFGPWLTYVSGGAAVLAISMLGREWRAAREAVERARRAEHAPVAAGDRESA